MILSILLELHIFNKDINIVNSAKRKKMVLKSFLTLNCNYSNKVKNCQGAGRFILKKRFTRSLTVNKHFFFGGREGTGWPYEKGKVFKTAVSQQTADLVTWSHLLKESSFFVKWQLWVNASSSPMLLKSLLLATDTLSSSTLRF